MSNAKLSPTAVAVLRAAKEGELRHSVYGGYDWYSPSEMNPTHCTGTARKLLRMALVELLPRERGDEHRGQRYRVTAAGEAELATHSECAS